VPVAAAALKPGGDETQVLTKPALSPVEATVAQDSTEPDTAILPAIAAEPIEPAAEPAAEIAGADQKPEPGTAILPSVPAEPAAEPAAAGADQPPEPGTAILPPTRRSTRTQRQSKKAEPAASAPRRVSIKNNGDKPAGSPGTPKRVSIQAKQEPAAAEPATPPMGVPAASPARPANALALFDAPPKPPPDPRRKRRRRRVVATVVVLALLLVMVGGVFGVNLYFTNLAKPGVRLAGSDVAGKDAAQVEQTVNRLAKSFRLELTDGKTQVSATAEQLGVKIDAAATTTQVMTATDHMPLWEALNPWQAKDIPLVATTDPTKLQQFLDQSFIAPEEEAVDARVEPAKGSPGFVAVAGMIGLLVDPAPVQEAIDLALANGAKGSLQIHPEQRPPDIPDEAAEQAAELANQALTTSITFTAQDWRALLAELQVDRATIANWVVFTPNAENHAIEVSYDQKAITTDVSETLAEQMAVPARPQIVVTRPDNGEDIGVKQWGLDGLKVADPAGAAKQVADALVQRVDVTIPIELADDAFPTEREVAPHEYNVPNGSPWVDVNLSTFRATTYLGTTEVGSYVISTGQSAIGHGTPSGTFYVYLKYEYQVMRGPPSDPYEAPTNWVSYFSGGVAFHSAPWNEPNRWGMEVSHGCVNMQTWAAREMYDFAPIGTKVEVHR